MLCFAGCNNSASLEKNGDSLSDVALTQGIENGVQIDSGEINNKTGLDISRKLNKSNGNHVHLYVENNGSNSVVATINGQSARTLKPGEKGYIRVEVAQDFFGTDKDYMFKVVPGTNGGSVNIRYEITQRNTF